MCEKNVNRLPVDVTCSFILLRFISSISPDRDGKNIYAKRSRNAEDLPSFHRKCIKAAKRSKLLEYDARLRNLADKSIKRIIGLVDLPVWDLVKKYLLSR